jgi:uncharacterized repeat protein (TIGR01451 family)
MAQSGDLLTYLINLNVTGSNAQNVVVQDTLPANVTFGNFTLSPPGTTTAYNALNSTLLWTLPSPLAPGNYQLTYQTKVNDFVKSGTVLTNNAQLTYTGGAPVSTNVNVTITGDFTVRIGVYNEAGEMVKQILVQQFSQPIDTFTLQTTSTITTLKGPGGKIDIYYGGNLIGTWDGTTQSNDPVLNGTYHIKLDNIDRNGAITSVSQEAIVSRKLAKVSANIYNEAGEIVRHLFALVDDPNGSDMTGVVLSSTVVQPGASAAGAPTSVQAVVQTSGVPVTLAWNGKSDQGTVVTQGNYQIGVHWDDGAGVEQDITRSVLVMGGGAGAGTVVAAPNILTQSTGLTSTTFQITSSNPYTLNASIYTVAGELIQVAQGNTGSNQVTWDASDVASGIYIAAVELRDAKGGLAGRQILKVLVVR